MKRCHRTLWLLGLSLLGACASQAPMPSAQKQEVHLTPASTLRPNPRTANQPWIRVDSRNQRLTLFDATGRVEQDYLVSTAKNGLGEKVGSLQTPRGWHRVCEKIGEQAAENTIIYRRNVTPWQYTPALHAEYPNKDWILTRILWLCGMEPGRNQGGDVDSYDRAIYIHGAGQHVVWGTPTSRGCVRMKSPDVIDLFRRVALGTDVLIEEDPE
ncbi:L,D-transpeptidase family protein [Craterilacuibacter sp.]|uniref:L,D-transpeptidase family protein n=1 Tax=Craterilacuibacter sp. TaxID=2870909 RepID=UPI003F3E2035